MIAGTAVTLAACGGGSGNLSAGGLAANRVTASNGIAGATLPAAGSPATGVAVPITGSGVPTTDGTPTTSSTSPAPGGGPGGSTSAGGAPGSGAPGSGAAGTGGSTPTAPAAAAPNGGDPTGSLPSTLPAAEQALTCPLLGVPSGQVNSFGLGQAIPAGFQPVAAVQCVPDSSPQSSSSQPADIHKEVAASGLSPLLAALLEPSAPPTGSPPAPRCFAPAAQVFQLALIDAAGTVIYPLIPVTGCGGPIEPVVASIAALDWTVVS